jgi:hypothetical protein
MPPVGACDIERRESRPMIDATTQRLLHVLAEGSDRPYVMVPFSQLDDLTQLLDKNRVRYSVDEDVMSLDGGPEIAVVDFGRGADATAIQTILDSVG